jgi:hypothetical protein
MLVWETLLLAAELSFGGPLFKTSGDDLSGLVGGRAGFGGLTVVPFAIYLFAFLRGPSRHPALLWLGVLEHAAALLLTVFHIAAGDLKVEGTIIPAVVSACFVLLLLTHMPRPTRA